MVSVTDLENSGSTLRTGPSVVTGAAEVGDAGMTIAWRAADVGVFAVLIAVSRVDGAACFDPVIRTVFAQFHGTRSLNQAICLPMSTTIVQPQDVKRGRTFDCRSCSFM